MSNIDKYTNFIAEQNRKGSVAGLRTESVQPITEDKTYSMDYDGEEEDTKGAKALDSAHDHFKEQGYKISHEGSDDPAHKEHKKPDVTYHYAMGDDMHHAFTVHKNGKAANDPHVKKFTKHLEDVTEHTAPDNTDKYTNYIAEQARKGSVAGLRTNIQEAAVKGATRFGSSDSMHKVVHNDGQSNLTLHSSSDGQDNTIRGKMHDAKTGQTHKINIKLHGDEHEGDDLHGAIHDTVKEKAHNLPSHIQKKIASAVSKGYND